MLLRRGAPLLVSDRASVPNPATLVALASLAVPAPRRPVEHPPLGPSDFLGPCALHLLCRRAASGGHHRPRRSSCGRRADVGPRVGRLSGAALRRRRATAVGPTGARQGDKET